MEVLLMMLSVMMVIGGVNTEETYSEPLDEATFGTSDYLLVYAAVVSALLVIIVTIGAVRRLKRKKPSKANDYRANAVLNSVGEYEEIKEGFVLHGDAIDDPQYEEIKEGLAPARPAIIANRSTQKKMVQQVAPQKSAFTEPDYIIPGDPDDPLSADGYLKPVGW